MGKRLTILTTAALVWAGWPAAASAKGLNVTILGDSAGPASFSEQSPTFQRARRTIESRLSDAGYRVFDGAAQEQPQKQLQEQAQERSIDVAVYLSVHASQADLTYATRITTWIAGRLVLVRSGRRLESLEFKAPPHRRAPGACDRRCVLNLVSADVEVLAGKLGDGIANKLGAVTTAGSVHPPVTVGDRARARYRLVFEEFSPEEAARAEEYLVVFPGYVRHRLRGDQPGRREHWYETDAPVERLKKSLTKMLGHMGMGGRIVAVGDRITVKKITGHGPGPANTNANDW